MKNILVSPFRSGGNGTKQVAAALLSPTPQVKRSDPPPHNIFTNNSLFALPKFAVHTPPLSKVSLFPSMKSHSNCIGSLINPPTADRRFVFVKEKEESEPTQSTSSQKSSTECFYGIFLTDSGNEGLLIQPLRHSPRTGQSYYLAWEGHLRLVKPENVTFIQMTSTPFGYQLQGPNESMTPLDETDLITLEDLSDLEEETSLCNEGLEKFSSSPVITAERSNNIFTTPLKDTTIVLSALSTNNTTIASFTPNSAIGEDELYWKEEDDVGYWPDLPPLVPTKLFEDDSPMPRKRKSSSSSAKRTTKKQKN